jgi:hypothetical protein
MQVISAFVRYIYTFKAILKADAERLYVNDHRNQNNMMSTPRL